MLRALLTLPAVTGMLIVTLSADRALAQTVSVSARIGDFHVAVANYYRVPEREVIVIRERRLPDYEIPVALFIAQRAAVAPARIVDLRLAGKSWWDISVRYGIGPEIYYVPVAVAPGPPYGRAYGHYKKPRDRWKTIVLSDDDVVDLVHLRFLTEHYRIRPEEVFELRGHQRDFVLIHTEVGERRRGGGNPEKGKSPGHGRGRGHK